MGGGGVLSGETDEPSFEDFFSEVEPRLRLALCARFGREAGREAALDALVYGWRHWDRVREMANPAGYLYRVGVSRVRYPAVTPVLVDPIDWRDPWIEPGLEIGLAALSENQRTAVVLHHGLDWSYEEIGSLMEVSVSTVRNHVRRGVQKLRASLGVMVDG
ncbi:MAG TPA: RNA polymerase sigma factor [Acidimicrobiia bacterium]